MIKVVFNVSSLKLKWVNKEIERKKKGEDLRIHFCILSHNYFGNSIILSFCINLYSFNIILKEEMKARQQLLGAKKMQSTFFW